MRIKPKSLAILMSTGLVLGLGTQANADEAVGTLARISGTAVVNQGAQYVVGREGMSLREGDRLLALEGGSALVTFSDGCQYRLQDDELLVVPAVSTCAASDAVATDANKVAPYSAVAEQSDAGAGANFRLAQLQGGGAAAASGLAVIPVAGAAAVALGAAIDSGDDDDAISP